MTDKTDIDALRDKHELALKDLTERLTECNRLNFCMDELSAFSAFSSTLIDQLEAERQQREAAESELAALRGEQGPVGFTNDKGLEALSKGYMVTITPDDRLLSPVPLFTRQPKPVVVRLPDALMPAIHNSGELFMTPDNVDQGGYLNRDDVTRVLRAAGIVVKDGE